METVLNVHRPESEDDQEGALRTFQEFAANYHQTLQQIDEYLDCTIADLDPIVAKAYEPWHNALQDLFHGVYLVAKKIPMPNPKAFVESMQIFSFDGAVQFLFDLCISCKLEIAQEWKKRFQEAINALMFAFDIINRQQQQAAITR